MRGKCDAVWLHPTCLGLSHAGGRVQPRWRAAAGDGPVGPRARARQQRCAHRRRLHQPRHTHPVSTLEVLCCYTDRGPSQRNQLGLEANCWSCVRHVKTATLRCRAVVLGYTVASAANVLPCRHDWDGWSKVERSARPPSARTAVRAGASGSPNAHASPREHTRSQSSSETSHPTAHALLESPELRSRHGVQLMGSPTQHTAMLFDLQQQGHVGLPPPPPGMRSISPGLRLLGPRAERRRGQLGRRRRRPRRRAQRRGIPQRDEPAGRRQPFR